MAKRLPANAVKEERLKRLMSPRQFAEFVGVSYDTIYRAERGLPVGDLSKERIAQALDIPRAELFPETDPEEATG